MKRLLFVLIFFIPFASAFSQDSEEITPASWNLNLNGIIPIELPEIDTEALKREDSINDLDKSLPYRYGVERAIILNLETHGEWTQLTNGDRIWRVAIKSPEAVNLSVNFEDFQLPDGAKLQLYNETRSDVSKQYTKKDNRSAKLLGSWYIRGDVIFIEYYHPFGSSGPVELEIGSIIHGYRLGRVQDLVQSNQRGLNDSEDCNYDVNCSIGSDFDLEKDLVKKAVALLNLGNGYLCSAALINNTLSDKTPFLLTANHCLDNSDPALWSVRFNWMSPNPICGTDDPSLDIQSNFTMSGATYRASSEQSDFALVELFNDIPSSWDVAFAGWDHSDDIPEFQVGIHHPNGDIMKICRDDDPAMKENANGTDVWLIKGVSAGNGNGWDIGTTESGSSGSPLFNQDGRIIGQLYAGQSRCDGLISNGDYDVYGRLAVSWNAGTSSTSRLMDWLDPISTGQLAIDGLSNSLSTPDFSLEGQLQVYPNPATDFIMIMNTRYPNLSFRFFNVVGQEIQSGNVSNSENRIDVAGLEEGVYFLQLIDQDTQDDITKKIIVTNYNR